MAVSLPLASRWRLLLSLLLIAIGTTATAWWLVDRGGYTHVILISIDTVRWDHLGCYGYPRDTTPSIDALAGDGVVFEAAFAPSTNTAPSHATILTGLYPYTHGVVRNRYQLKEGVETLAQYLEPAGFRSGAFVSSYTLQKKHTNLDRGFGHYDDALTTRTERFAKQTNEAAVAWLKGEAHLRDPTFLFFHLFDPHYPYTPPAEYARRFAKPGRTNLRAGGLHQIRAKGGEPEQLEEYVRFYDSELAYADATVGELFSALERHGYWNESLVIVLSDHGETLDDRTWPFDHGARAYEEQIRVPLIIRFPDGTGAGRRISVPVHHVDIVPTILEYLRLPLPPGLQGRSLMPLIRGSDEGDPKRLIFSSARPEPERVKEIEAPLVKEGQILALRAWPNKLIAYPATGGFFYQLFDLARDPKERTSLAAERIEEVQKLAELLLAWREQTGGEATAAEPVLSPEEEATLEALGYTR